MSESDDLSSSLQMQLHTAAMKAAMFYQGAYMGLGAYNFAVELAVRLLQSRDTIHSRDEAIRWLELQRKGSGGRFAEAFEGAWHNDVIDRTIVAIRAYA